MSYFKDLKRVKLSSVERGIQPEDEDEAFAGEQKQTIAGCNDRAKQKTPKDASEAATAIATSDTANGIDLVEDVLMLIFEADFLDTTDLLHCRLVNRSWRDSATSVLLRSSACQISFNILWVPIPSTIRSSATQAVYCNNNNYNALLDDLNEIISQSPRFPCSNFRFFNSFGFRDAHHVIKMDTLSLNKFFSIHGNNVRTITVGDQILKTDLRPLLLNCAPNLECLDLQALNHLHFGNPDPPDQPLFLQSTILPNLKTLVLGRSTRFNLIELVDAAINLHSVEITTGVDNLRVLLDHGKVGLIKKVKCGLYVRDLEECSVFEKLAESQPKLTQLIVTTALHPLSASNYVSSECFTNMQNFLNIILESSKDTLKYLEFRICPFADIKFPILKNLECLKLVQSRDQQEGGYSTLPSSSLDELQPYEDGDEGQFDARRLCPNRPCDSFPNLTKVQLDIENYGVGRDGSLFLLHTCRSHNTNIVPHAYKTVKVLEIYSQLLPTFENAKSVSNLFPNVTVLKLKCGSGPLLNSSLWVLCPLAKSIEIYGMSTKYHFSKKRYRGIAVDESKETDRVALVDSFFTGFSTEMCKKLKELEQIPSEMEGNPVFMDFMRVKPSICDLKDLTDFKMLFTKLQAPFASHVTGLYAFRTMPRTNFTFAHVSPIEYNETECDMEKHLAPISSFVHITHRNQPQRFGNDDNYD